MRLKKTISGIFNTILTFFYLIYRDIKVFTRRKSSLMLVFISPFVMMVLLGTTFSVGTNVLDMTNVKGIPLVLCNYDNDEISQVMIKELKNSTFFEMDYFDKTFFSEQECAERVHKDIVSGKYRVAILFPSNFTRKILDGEGQNLVFYVDNSHTEIRNTVYIFMLAYTHEMSRQVGKTFIQRTWEKLDEVNAKMQLITGDLESIQKNATAIKGNLESSRTKLNSLNTQELQDNIQFLDQQISAIEQVRSQINSAVNETRGDISLASNQLDEMKNITASAKEKIDSTTIKLDSMIAPLQLLKSGLVAFKATLTCPSDLCTQIDLVINQADSTVNELNTTKNDLLPLKDSIDAVNAKIDQQGTVLQSTQSKLQQVLAGAQASDARIQEVKGKVSNLRSSLAQVSTIKTESETIIDQSEAGIDDVLQNIGVITPDIQKAQEGLSGFTKKSPENIVQPIALQGIDVYKNRRYIDFLLPGIIGLVLMFSCMLLSSISLIQEKNSGTFTRTLLTPTPMALTLVARVVSNMIFAGLQIGILMLVAIVLYKVQIIGELKDVFIISETVALSFITVGLIIGAFSKSENTAILAAIALGLPMLFLCGLLFPSELMPSIMRAISSFLPLTYGIVAMRRIIVYGAVVSEILPDVVLLLAQSGVAFWIAEEILKKSE